MAVIERAVTTVTRVDRRTITDPRPMPACPVIQDNRRNNITPQMLSRHLIWKINRWRQITWCPWQMADIFDHVVQYFFYLDLLVYGQSFNFSCTNEFVYFIKWLFYPGPLSIYSFQVLFLSGDSVQVDMFWYFQNQGYCQQTISGSDEFSGIGQNFQVKKNNPICYWIFRRSRPP